MINVIIADDDINTRSGLMKMIEWQALGANVVAVAEDGEQVVQFLEQYHGIDLVILDICMPYMDGLSVAKYIREKAFDTEIVLLSAHAEFDYAREALKYDIREYILKPINCAKLDLLSETIKSVAEDKEKNIKWRVYLRGTELADEVKKVLHSRDINAIEKLLDIEKKFGQISVEKIKEYYSVLLEMLLKYYKSAFKETEELEMQMQTFYKISDAKSAKEFLAEKFNECISVLELEDGKNGTDIVTLAKRYIDENVFGSNISSFGVASHFNLSVDHLSRLFKNSGEGSLSDYIIQIKIERAKDILSNSSHSIRRVAELLGYTDSNYFVKLFKKRTGMTPKEYRINTRAGRNEVNEG